MYGLMTVS